MLYNQGWTRKVSAVVLGRWWTEEMRAFSDRLSRELLPRGVVSSPLPQGESFDSAIRKVPRSLPFPPTWRIYFNCYAAVSLRIALGNIIHDTFWREGYTVTKWIKERWVERCIIHQPVPQIVILRTLVIDSRIYFRFCKDSHSIFDRNEGCYLEHLKKEIVRNHFSSENCNDTCHF